MEEVTKDGFADDEKTVVDRKTPAVPDDTVVDKKVDQAPEAPSPIVTRLEFVIRYFGLPRAIVLEVMHKSVSEDEMRTAAQKLDKIINEADLSSRVDECSLRGIAAWFGRRSSKLLNGRVEQVGVAWKPEMTILEQKQWEHRG